MHSVHETLLRDVDVARDLHRAGVSVLAQTCRAATLAHDKLAMRDALEAAGLQLPAAPTGRAAQVVVIKRVDGTAGKGMRRAVWPTALQETEFAEVFVRGWEVSVNLYVPGVAPHAVTLPPVFKGATASDLRPPYLRARSCPLPRHLQDLDDTFREAAQEAAAACGATGFCEVEFIVDRSTGDMLVLEVNPRVSGTLRVSAMAADCPVLALVGHDWSHHIPATRAAVEEPFDGTPFCDLRRGVVATARLTITGATVASARRRLAAYRQPALKPANRAATSLADHCADDGRWTGEADVSTEGV